MRPLFNKKCNKASNNVANINDYTSSPAQIRTGVKGSKGLYAWPLHSALKKILPGFRAFVCYTNRHY